MTEEKIEEEKDDPVYLLHYRDRQFWGMVKKLSIVLNTPISDMILSGLREKVELNKEKIKKFEKIL